MNMMPVPSVSEPSQPQEEKVLINKPVLVISHDDPTTLTLYYFGKGVLESFEVPPKETWPKGSWQHLCASLNRPQAKIVLENGDIVWGSECWYITTDEFTMEDLANYTWKLTSIQEQREQLTTFMIDEETLSSSGT